MGQLKHKYSKETWLFMEFGTSNLFKANARPATHFFFSFEGKKEKRKKAHTISSYYNIKIKCNPN